MSVERKATLVADQPKSMNSKTQGSRSTTTTKTSASSHFEPLTLLWPRPDQEALIRWTKLINPPHLLLHGPPGSGTTRRAKDTISQVVQGCWHATASFNEDLKTEIEVQVVTGPTGHSACYLHMLSWLGTPAKALSSTAAKVLHEFIQVWTQPMSLTSSVYKTHTRRFLVLDNVDYLPETSQCLLLRLLESQTHQVTYIFVAKQPHKLKPSLRSRLLHLRIPAPTCEQIRELCPLHEPSEGRNIKQAQAFQALKQLQAWPLPHEPWQKSALRILYIRKRGLSDIGTHLKALTEVPPVTVLNFWLWNQDWTWKDKVAVAQRMAQADLNLAGHKGACGPYSAYLQLWNI